MIRLPSGPRSLDPSDQRRTARTPPSVHSTAITTAIHAYDPRASATSAATPGASAVTAVTGAARAPLSLP